MRNMVKLGDVVAKLEEVGDSVEGIWNGVEEGTDYDWGVFLDDTGLLRTRLPLGASLQHLQKIPVGVYMQVTFTGTQNSRQGRAVKQFDVLVDADDLKRLQSG